MSSRVRTFLSLCLMVAGLSAGPQSASAETGSGFGPIPVEIGAGQALCVLYSDGQVSCSSSLPVPSGLPRLKTLSVGGLGACGIAINDVPVCWGNGDAVQTRVPAGLGKVIDIRAYSDTTCAVTVDNQGRCWGNNAYGHADVPEDWKIIQLSPGAQHTCALLVGGQVKCWGNDADGQSGVPDDLGPVKRVVAGSWHTCVLTDTDAVRCWGRTYGEGNVPASLGVVRGLTSGDVMACAINSSDIPVCWGWQKLNRSIPDGLGRVTSMAISWEWACALSVQHSIRCWGDRVFPGLIPDGPPVSFPDSPEGVTASTGNEQATVNWSPPFSNGGGEIKSYTATASPGAATCTTTALSCTVPGLTNRQSYTFTVTATNAAGASEPSEPSAAVMPLAPGFQAWSDDSVLSVDSSTTLRLAQAAATASIAVTGAAKASVTADSAGFGSTSFTATKAGVQKFTATYSVKVGKKSTKYTATTQLYVPSLSGPMLKIKQGKTGKFSLQFMPPGAAVSIALSDGRTLTGTADSAGKASFTPTFNTLGAVTYTATVAGVQIGTGGLTVTK